MTNFRIHYKVEDINQVDPKKKTYHNGHFDYLTDKLSKAVDALIPHCEKMYPEAFTLEIKRIEVFNIKSREKRPS